MSDKTMSHKLNYKDWITQEAALIRADGCTGITNHDGICCLIHDLDYYYGRDSSHAYLLYCAGEYNYWKNAVVITRKFADDSFIKCNHRESWLGYLNPFAWWRRLVKKGGQGAWDRHRKREQEQDKING